MAVGVFDEGERETQTARYETVRWLFFFYSGVFRFRFVFWPGGIAELASK